MGRLVSFILRMPSSLSRRERAEQIVAQLSRVGGAEQPVRPLPDAVAAALAEHLLLAETRPSPDVFVQEKSRRREPTQVAAPRAMSTAPKVARAEKVEFLDSLRTNESKGASPVNELRPEVKQAAQVLGNVLKNTPPLRAYADAIATMTADAEATALLDQLQDLQADIRVRQSNGGVSQEDLARLRQLQSQVQTHPTIAAFIEAQQSATAYLPQVNQEISQLLGIDFASLAAPASC